MADEGFEEWDADFLEKVIQVEELAIAATQRKSAPPPVLPPQPQPLVRLGYAHEGFQTSYSPPRELSQRAIKTEATTTVVEREKRRSVREAANGVAAVAPVARSSRSGRGGSGSESGISRLKRELERVSKQLTHREQECLELRKERDKKEVQLQSATLPKEARTSHAPGLRTTHLDLIIPSPAEVSARCLDLNASTDQGSSRFGSSSYHTKGVQTDVEFDDLPLTSDKENSSCNSLSKKLKAIRCSSGDLYSGKCLVSKLLVVCATELQVLFGYCKSPICSKPNESINDKNLTHVTSVDDDMLICSSESAKVSRFYTIVTKMSNGMVQFVTFYKALLDICNLQNAVVMYRSLSILRVVLLHLAGYQHISTRRDNCAIESTNNAAALSGTESIQIGYHKHHDGGSPYVSDTSPSCIEWLSLFQLMHQISTNVTDEPILYETVSIMNVILKRDGPLERERYGHITVFQTVPKLLKKDAGLRVQKEAVDLLYLLVNCPTVLSSLYSGFKEGLPNSNGDSDVSPFEGLYNIFAGLEDCLTCSGTGLEALGLHRNAITLLSYLVSFGSSGYEVLWSSTTRNKISFLVLILRLLASTTRNELLKELIQELYKENKQPIPHIDSMDVVKRIEEVQRCLKDRRYVIVLDDVWGVHAWKEIKYAFPKDACGSRVVITTRATDVASASCTSKEHIYNLEPLSKEDSLTLFCLKTFDGKPCPEHLVGVSNRILKKCAGLPLAIVAISGVLITKDMTAVSNEWDQINRRLGTELEDNEILKSTYKILSLSYNDLPYYLRACYLYTGIFHEDQPIPRTKLIRLWIAEGFVEGKEGNTPEEVAESYLNELLNRSLLEVEERTSDGRVKSCRIHDLLRQIIIRKSRDQSFAAIAKENGGSWPEKVRRLSVHNMLQYIHNQNFPQLRSLLMFGVEEPLSRSSMTALFTGGCKLLTVLDLQGTNLTKFPLAVIKLFNLRYLSLRDTMVKKIPEGIGALQKLETLDLKRTLVSKLPTEILKFQSLRNLLVYRYEFEGYGIFNSKFGIKAPKGIGGLKSLQKLCFVEGGQGNESILRELQTLSTLRRLGVINLINENCAALCASIDKMQLLHALSINSLKDEILNLQHITSPPKSIRRLYLMGQMNTLPHWIKSLKNLVKIVLKKTKLHNDPLKTLEELPNLVHIEFLQVHNGEKLQFKAGKFQRLKLLGIHESESLERVIVEESSMPNLERFFIKSCGMLKEIPSGMDTLHKLKELHFVNMPRELITTIQLHPREGKDYKRVSHIPDVTVTYTVDGNWEIERLSTTHQHRNSQNTEMKKRINDLWEK